MPEVRATTSRVIHGALGEVYRETEVSNPLTIAPPRPPARRPRRDEQIRRFVRRLRTLAPHLDNPVHLPMLQAFAQVTLTLQKSYAFLKERDVINEDGELRSSVDTVRRLAETQARLAKELGLTPSTLRSLSREKPIDLAAAMAESDE